LHLSGAPRGFGDRRVADVVLALSSIGVTGPVVSRLSQDPGAEDVCKSGKTEVNLGVRVPSSLSGSGTRGCWHRRRWGEFWAGERRRESVAGRYLGRYVSRAVHPARSLAHKAAARVQGAVGAARVKSAVARVSWAVRRNPQHGASALP